MALSGVGPFDFQRQIIVAGTGNADSTFVLMGPCGGDDGTRGNVYAFPNGTQPSGIVAKIGYGEVPESAGQLSTSGQPFIVVPTQYTPGGFGPIIPSANGLPTVSLLGVCGYRSTSIPALSGNTGNGVIAFSSTSQALAYVNGAALASVSVLITGGGATATISLNGVAVATGVTIASYTSTPFQVPAVSGGANSGLQILFTIPGSGPGFQAGDGYLQPASTPADLYEVQVAMVSSGQPGLVSNLAKFALSLDGGNTFGGSVNTVPVSLPLLTAGGSAPAASLTGVPGNPASPNLIVEITTGGKAGGAPAVTQPATSGAVTVDVNSQPAGAFTGTGPAGEIYLALTSATQFSLYHGGTNGALVATGISIPTGPYNVPLPTWLQSQAASVAHASNIVAGNVITNGGSIYVCSTGAATLWAGPAASSGTVNDFSTGGSQASGTLVWTEEATVGSPSNWATTTYSANAIVKDPSHTANLWITPAGGTSSGSSAFPSGGSYVSGATYTDPGSVIWYALPAWLANTLYTSGAHNYVKGAGGTYAYLATTTGTSYNGPGTLLAADIETEPGGTVAWTYVGPGSLSGVKLWFDGTFTTSDHCIVTLATPAQAEFCVDGSTFSSPIVIPVGNPAAWAAGSVTRGLSVTSNGQVFTALNAGTATAGNAPSGTVNVTTGDGIQWAWIEPASGVSGTGQTVSLPLTGVISNVMVTTGLSIVLPNGSAQSYTSTGPQNTWSANFASSPAFTYLVKELDGTFIGCALAFNWGAYVANTTYSAVTTPPTSSQAQFDAAMTALLAARGLPAFGMLNLVGGPQAYGTTAPLVADFEAQLEALPNSTFLFLREVVNGPYAPSSVSGAAPSDAAAAFAATVAPRTLVAGGTFLTTSVLTGRQQQRPLGFSLMQRLATVPIIANDPGFGELGGLNNVEVDAGDTSNTDCSAFDDARVCCAQNPTGTSNIQINRGITLATPGTAEALIQRGRAEDKACRLTVPLLRPYANAGVPTTTGGVIEPNWAGQQENAWNMSLAQSLPVNSNPNAGNAPTINLSIDRTYDVADNEEMPVILAIGKWTYVFRIPVTVGFV